MAGEDAATPRAVAGVGVAQRAPRGVSGAAALPVGSPARTLVTAAASAAAAWTSCPPTTTAAAGVYSRAEGPRRERTGGGGAGWMHALPARHPPQRHALPTAR